MKTEKEINELAYKYAEIYRCPATNENEYCKHDIISAYNKGYTQCKEDMDDKIIKAYQKGWDEATTQGIKEAHKYQ